jgi:hypothetical protein
VDDEALKNVVFQQLQKNESNYTGWEHLFLFKGGRRLVTKGVYGKITMPSGIL